MDSAEVTSRILGSKDLYVQEGGVLNLTCEVTTAEGSREEDGMGEEAEWSRGDGKRLTGGERRTIETQRRTVGGRRSVVSHLVVLPTKREDSGVYLCGSNAGKGGPDSVNVHVIKGPSVLFSSVSARNDGTWSVMRVIDL